jgi:hypothetical protein
MKVWLDDTRKKPANYDVHVKTAEDAISLLKTGQVKVMSFDHDLGSIETTGYDVAKYVSQEAYHGRMAPFGWTVHSANPVGRSNIIATLQQADKWWKRNGLI